MSPVDFLLVAALKDEADEIRRLLDDHHYDAELTVGTIKRWKTQDSFVVGVLDLFGMGTNNAQAKTHDAIGIYQPRAVLMSGIAAGFQDSHSGVELGDLMIPSGVVPYELAKIREATPSDVGVRSWLRRRLDRILGSPARASAVDHRGVAWAVADSLWRVAANTANDSSQPWCDRITEPRPLGARASPVVHALADTVIGCGEKVVADKEAEVRRWLLAQYPRQILGLEMESYGVLCACRSFDMPFLLAKAAVDRATAEKDDRWRIYGCQLSAAFLVTVLERYERPQATLLARHRSECVEIEQSLPGKLPELDFGCAIRVAPTFEQLRRREYEAAEHGIDVLLPSDTKPTVVLYGGGGTGKTTITWRLFGHALRLATIPVLLDLKRYQPKGGTSDISDDRLTEDIIEASSVPRRSLRELRALAAQATSKFILIVDGVNEVSDRARRVLASCCDDLQQRTGCRVLWTNRMLAMREISPRALHATVERVSHAVACRLYDGRFGVGRFEALGSRLKSIIIRPFFRDLAIRSGRPFSGQRLWSHIFREFFREHLSLDDNEMEQLARVTLDWTLAGTGAERFNEMLGERLPELRDNLNAGQVRIVGKSGDFEHHLWKDYLLSRAIAGDRTVWVEKTFDAATTFASSAECLSLVVEQLDLEGKTTFIKSVYDWNYGVALECVEQADPAEEEERRLPDYVRESVAAVVAEKRFDDIPRTASRTDTLLSQFAFAREYAAAPNREALAERVRAPQSPEEWFDSWRSLFVKLPGTQLEDSDVDKIGEADPLVGWTAANLARREYSLKFNSCVFGASMTTNRALVSDRASGGGWSTHWADGQVIRIDLLSRALNGDPYHWVQYGAARSLVEMAALAEGASRDRALSALMKFLRDAASGGALRHLILQEIVEASFIKIAVGTWKQAVLALGSAVIEAEINRTRRESLAARVAQL